MKNTKKEISDKQVAEVSGLRSTKPNTYYKYLLY